MADGPSLKMERWEDGEMGKLEDETSGQAMLEKLVVIDPNRP
jgi:hypothetical protein